MNFLKKWWKFSRLRFYYLNSKWNIRFWLHSKKIYKNVSFYVGSNDFTSDYTNIVKEKKRLETRKRFAGFMFENKLYWDNPGLPPPEPDTWQVWREKGLLK